MKFKIGGYQIQEMAAEEILDHVSASAYKRIKKDDPKAEFRAYVIGHEGESSGKVVGMGRVVKKWARSAVEHINEKLNIGTKIFHLHGVETNDHDGRKPIGEVVGKVLSDIAGRLSSIAIAYIYPDFHDVPLDVASIEADINMPETINPNARAVDVDVEKITGIALGSSEIVKPGFEGATLLASMQEFAESNTESNRQGGAKQMTAAEIKKAIREAGLQPSDVFSLRDITADPSIEEEMRESTPANREFIRLRQENKDLARQVRDLEGRATAAESENKTLKDQVGSLGEGLLKTKAAESLKSAIATRKLDEKQAAFINKNAAKFAPKSESTLAGDLNTFIDAQLDDFKGFAELIGYKPAAPAGGTAGLPAGNAGGSSTEDLLTPDNLKDAIPK
jgi:hypothetical protein